MVKTITIIIPYESTAPVLKHYMMKITRGGDEGENIYTGCVI